MLLIPESLTMLWLSMNTLMFMFCAWYVYVNLGVALCVQDESLHSTDVPCGYVFYE